MEHVSGTSLLSDPEETRLQAQEEKGNLIPISDSVGGTVTSMTHSVDGSVTGEKCLKGEGQQVPELITPLAVTQNQVWLVCPSCVDLDGMPSL